MISGKGKGQRKCSTLRAEDGTRTRDPDLGKVVLYQLSYFRNERYFRNDCCFYKCDCKVTFLFRDDKILSGENRLRL